MREISCFFYVQLQTISDLYFYIKKELLYSGKYKKRRKKKQKTKMYDRKEEKKWRNKTK